MAGKIIAPAAKGGRSRAPVELPEYNPDTKQIRHEGRLIDAPDGTKFQTDDGQTFILHHARHVEGGWKRMRVVEPKPTADKGADKKK